jgi:hypothetical protein
MRIKTIIVTAALAAVVASPALAQTSRRAGQQPSVQSDQSYGRVEAQPRSGSPTNDVYENGRYLGADPDPNVRLQMRLDAEHRDF